MLMIRYMPIRDCSYPVLGYPLVRNANERPVSGSAKPIWHGAPPWPNVRGPVAVGKNPCDRPSSPASRMNSPTLPGTLAVPPRSPVTGSVTRIRSAFSTPPRRHRSAAISAWYQPATSDAVDTVEWLGSPAARISRQVGYQGPPGYTSALDP